MHLIRILLIVFVCVTASNFLVAQTKIGGTLGLAQYDIPQDIDNNLVKELNVNHSKYESIYLDIDYGNRLDSNSIIIYHLGYRLAYLSFGPQGLGGLIGTSSTGNISPEYQRNGADYWLHYLSVGADYSYFFSGTDKGFSVSAGPRLYYQIGNNHRRARLLENGDVVALPIEDKQNGLNKFAAHIDLAVAYNVSINSLHFAIGFQNSIRVRSFYSDIPIRNRYFSKGLFFSVHF